MNTKTAVMKQTHQKKISVFAIICRVVLIAMVVVWIFPILFSLMTSFKTIFTGAYR